MRALAIFLLFLLGKASLCAAPPLIGVDLKLLSEVRTIKAGQPFTVGLHIHHHESFHTYWKNPGIVGVPTGLKWTLPEGFTAGPIQWPSPEIVDMAGHPAHGYHRNVLLLVEITPPATVTGKELVLRAEAHWMACAKTCHPGNTSLTLPLSVGTKVVPDPTTQATFAETRQGHPLPLLDWTVTLRSAPDAPRVLLHLAPKKEPSAPLRKPYFFSSDGQISSNQAQSLTMLKDGTYLLTLTRNKFGPTGAPSLPGLLRIHSPDEATPTLEGTINPAYLKVQTKRTKGTK
jgi:DsbC/DsbD-like thiol-disulfide interchange protein